MDSKAVDQLILSIYRAAEAPEEWPACLALLNAAFGGTGAAILYQDEISRFGIQAASGFSPEILERYTIRYGKLDPWANALRPADFVPGRVMDGREVVSEQQVRKTEYFAAMGSECAQALIGFLEPSGERVGAITVNRGSAHEGFEEPQRQLMATLLPHLRQALRIHRRLTVSEGERSLACDALDRLSAGVVLLNPQGAPVFVNNAAAAIAAQKDGVAIDSKGIRLASSAARTALAKSIATAGSLAGDTEAGTPLTVPRPSGRLPFTLVVAPAGRRYGPLGIEVGASVAVFITDPEIHPVHDEARLRRVFNFTPAEARVAMAIARGDSPKEIAQAMDISINTARSHVKHALHKAGARSQSQLVARVLGAYGVAK